VLLLRERERQAVLYLNGQKWRSRRQDKFEDLWNYASLELMRGCRAAWICSATEAHCLEYVHEVNAYTQWMRWLLLQASGMIVWQAICTCHLIRAPHLQPQTAHRTLRTLLYAVFSLRYALEVGREDATINLQF